MPLHRMPDGAVPTPPPRDQAPLSSRSRPRVFSELCGELRVSPNRQLGGDEFPGRKTGPRKVNYVRLLE